jgi:pimeloyl-ACP methyl ester carboxylesterase
VTDGLRFIAIGGQKLEYLRILNSNPGARTIVFLHEGLGSISLWRDFPRRLAQACDCHALVYSRHGNGGSSALAEPRRGDYMHREALDVLPALLDAFSIKNPVLFGHSDGGSIALIYAGSGLAPPAGVIVCAPHVFVEDSTIASIAAAGQAYVSTDLREKLSRHHSHVDQTFRGWNDIWLHPDFRSWRIDEYLPRIRCPVLALQGYEDEYGTMAQLDYIKEHTTTTRLVRLNDCRHSPHRDQPEILIAECSDFIRLL